MKRRIKDRIMEMHRAGIKNAEIARAVGCLDAYVRVVTRQRKGGGVSDIDRRYMANGGKAKKSAYLARRYHGEPDFRALCLAKSAAQWRAKKKARAEAAAQAGTP